MSNGSIKGRFVGIVSRIERCPGVKDENFPKFFARKDKALATIVLSVETSLPYLLGEPEDPAEVWKKLESQFQKKARANKLQIRRNLVSLRFKESDSVQQHIEAMTEIFDGLSVIVDPIPEEVRVVHLLASLPKSYNVLVTSREANDDVPKRERGRGNLGARGRKERNACKDAIVFSIFHAQILSVKIVIGQNFLNVNLRLNTFFRLVEINITPVE